MKFNSYIFIFLFLPITILIYFLFNRIKKYKLAKICLILASLFFYGYYDIKYVFLILFSICFNYIFSKIKLNKYLLTVGIVLNVIPLIYFKYYNFLISSINLAFNMSISLNDILFPLGISFFTIQQIAYIVDSYKGETKEYKFIDYFLFVIYFPKIISGPISLHKELIPQFNDKKLKSISTYNLSRGLYEFSIGLFKKVIIATTFSKAVNWGFSNLEWISSMDMIIVSLSYTFQLYFDFSGYSDMAYGISHMLNIDLIENFNSPYKSYSIIEFWNKWHISLTRFLREYIYFPLGGSKKGNIRTYINILVVFLISGIWHGANFTFIVWGILHGIINILNRIFKKSWDKVNDVTKWFINFSIINITWIIFRADNIKQAYKAIRKIFELSNLNISNELNNSFALLEFEFLNRFKIFSYFNTRISNFYVLLFIFGSLFVILNKKNIYEIKFKPTLINCILTVIFLVLSIISFAGVSDFLYSGY